MRRSTLILVPLLLAACTAQITAHEQSVPKRINPDVFEPVVINKEPAAPPAFIVDTVTKPEPTKPPIKQPKPKKEVVIKQSVVPRATANSNPKKYALSVVGQKQFNCLEPLWDRESGWNYKALNKSSGAYGIPQALPGSKMASAGDDWKTNPITQVKWGIRYVNARYGSACGAWNFWKNNHWY